MIPPVRHVRAGAATGRGRRPRDSAVGRCVEPQLVRTPSRSSNQTASSETSQADRAKSTRLDRPGSARRRAGVRSRGSGPVTAPAEHRGVRPHGPGCGTARVPARPDNGHDAGSRQGARRAWAYLPVGQRGQEPLVERDEVLVHGEDRELFAGVDHLGRESAGVFPVTGTLQGPCQVVDPAHPNPGPRLQQQFVNLPRSSSNRRATEASSTTPPSKSACLTSRSVADDDMARHQA